MHRHKCIFAAAILLSLAVSGEAGAQMPNGIASPRDNAVVTGQVLIEGTATDPDFLRYELSFFKEFDPLGEWVVFVTEERPVANGVLAVWDTTVGRVTGTPFYPDGTYRLRLRVVRRDSNYDEYFVLGLSLANETATTPTATPGSELTPSPTPTYAVLIPTELPTLTPFPTATPRATPVSGGQESAAQAPPSETEGTVLRFEGEFDTQQVKGGLLTGIKITVGFFIALAGYLLLRTILRFMLTRARSWAIWPWLRERFTR